MNSFSHLNKNGKGHMVDVVQKNETERIAVAAGSIKMNKDTLLKVKFMEMKKGDVISVAQLAGIMGAKKTSDLIPLCHNISLHAVDLEFSLNESTSSIDIKATVKTVGKTGVEMEALTAVSIAALTIYDMCKAIDKDMIVYNVRLIEKVGGKSGYYKREE